MPQADDSEYLLSCLKQAIWINFHTLKGLMRIWTLIFYFPLKFSWMKKIQILNKPECSSVWQFYLYGKISKLRKWNKLKGSALPCKKGKKGQLTFNSIIKGNKKKYSKWSRDWTGSSISSHALVLQLSLRAWYLVEVAIQFSGKSTPLLLPIFLWRSQSILWQIALKH